MARRLTNPTRWGRVRAPGRMIRARRIALLFLVSDIAATFAALVVAYDLRFRAEIVPATHGQDPNKGACAECAVRQRLKCSVTPHGDEQAAVLTRFPSCG